MPMTGDSGEKRGSGGSRAREFKFEFELGFSLWSGFAAELGF